MVQPSGVPLASPAAIINPHYCAPYPIDLAIVRKVLTLAQGNFDVTDINGNILFKVKEGHLSFVHERKLILDAAGNPIVTLRRKAMTAHSRWQAFRGESIDPKDLIFNAKTHSLFYLKTRLDVFLANNTAEEVCDFRVKGSFSQRSCVIHSGDNEDSSTIVAQMHKKHTAGSIFLGKDNFGVTVNPNIDYAFIVALIVILDDINREASTSAAAGSSGSAAAAVAISV